MNDLWMHLAARAAITLTQSQHNLFNRYLDLLAEANQRMNLTRIVDRPTAEIAHIGDALTLLPFLPRSPSPSIVDVGSGGGVPGIPLAIIRPNARVVLAESTRKKALFLSETVETLRLDNLTVLPERVEDVGRDPRWRESFDIATCRAVASTVWLCEWCLPLVKKGGAMLAMKGPKAAEELPLAEHAIALVGGGRVDIHAVDLPGTHSHVVIEIAKIRKTPSSYPRPASMAKGKPL